MARYTIELYCLLDLGYEIGLDQYPIFDETYRSTLNDKIKSHFYFREIGQETPDRFRQMLRRTMGEIMPYYNKLYETENAAFDFLTNVNITEDMDKDTGESMTGTNTSSIATNTGETSNESTSTTDGGTDVSTSLAAAYTDTQTGSQTNAAATDSKTTVFKDTPNGILTSADYATTVTEETDNVGARSISDSQQNAHGERSGSQTTQYGKTETRTNNAGRTINGTQNANGTNNTNKIGTEDYTKTLSGYRGVTPDELLKKHRENILNIDMQIIKELEPLFLNLY